MSRTIMEFRVNKPDDFVRFVAEDFFTKEGFTRKTYKTGEVVWTKGVGMATAPQFYKVESHDGLVHLEAWMAKLALPGLPLGETGTTGFWGWAVKGVMRDRVQHLTQLLTQDVDIPAEAAAVQQPIPVKVHNPENKATISLILGILSIAACILPIFGAVASVACGCIAISTGRVGKRSGQKSMAQAGFVMGIIGLCLGVLLFLGNILLVVLGYAVYLG